MKKRIITLLFAGALLGGTVTSHAQQLGSGEFTIEQQARIDSMVQKYVQQGVTEESARRRVEGIVSLENQVSTRTRQATPPTKSIWVNRDPNNPANPHPIYDVATAEDLIKKVLLSDSTAQSRITNVIFNGTSGGANRSLAYFENGQYLGIPRGLILGTFKVMDAEGPNVSSGNFSGGTNMLTGDPHLTPLASATVQDGSILQFDFQPYEETISFDYIFASEEYPEYSNSTFNDIFGFFIWETSTPGVYKNIARFPNDSVVTINNSNWGKWTGGNTQALFPAPLNGVYPALAVNHQWHMPNYQDVAGSDSIMEYDGRTIRLRAMATGLDTTKTYTLKLAIANIQDRSLGSGIFLANLNLGKPTGNIQTDFDKDGGPGWKPVWDADALARNDFYADCTQKISFKVTKSPSQDRRMHFDFYPSDMQDYMLVNGKSFPDSVYVPKGTDTTYMMHFTVGELPSSLEGVEFQILTYFTDTFGVPAPGSDTTRMTFYNHPAYNIEYTRPTVGYSGKLKLNLKGGSPYLMRSLDRGHTWKLASEPVSSTELYNFQDEDGYLWLKEPNSCWDKVIALGVSEGGTGIMRPITIPEVADAQVNFSPGIYYTQSRTNFSFTIVPTGANAGKVPVVTTNRTAIPDSEGVEIVKREDGSYKVTLISVQEPVSIQVDFVAAGTEQIAENVQVWANKNQLFLSASATGQAKIYTAAGALVKTIAVTAGDVVETTLPAGFYVVNLNGSSTKVVIK